MGGPHPIKGLNITRQVSKQVGILQKTAIRPHVHHWLSWVCNLPVLTTDFGPVSLHNFMSQFFMISISIYLYQFSSVAQHVRLFATPQTAAGQASLSTSNSCSLLKLMSIESVIPSNHLILYRPLLLLPSIFPSIGVFSWRRKWQPMPVLLTGESRGWRSLVGCRLWGLTASDTTEAT